MWKQTLLRAQFSDYYVGIFINNSSVKWNYRADILLLRIVAYFNPKLNLHKVGQN